MARHRHRSIPVVAGHRMVGIVARQDLVAALARGDDDIMAELKALLDELMDVAAPYRIDVADGVVGVRFAEDRAPAGA